MQTEQRYTITAVIAWHDTVDEVTGERVSTDWVEYEAYLRAQKLETVGQRGVW